MKVLTNMAHFQYHHAKVKFGESKWNPYWVRVNELIWHITSMKMLHYQMFGAIPSKIKTIESSLTSMKVLTEMKSLLSYRVNELMWH